VGIIESFPTAQSDATPVTEFGQDKWSVSYAGHDLGTLSQYPDFVDAMALLRHVAKQRVGGLHVSMDGVPQGGSASQAKVFDEHSLIQELESLIPKA